MTTQLTSRQEEVLAAVVRGETSKEIAARLGISERGVKAHLTRLYERFGVENRSGLIGAVLSSESEFARYERAPFMVAVTHGPRHRYVYMNVVAADVAGRRASEIVGREVLEIYPELDRAFLAALDDVYRSGVPRGFANAPARFTLPDGGYRDTILNLIFQPLRAPDGSIEGILHIGAEVAD